MAAKQEKNKSKLSKVLSIIVDIFFIPTIVLALICVVIMFAAKSNNKVPSVFGVSIVTVLSNSMEDKFYKNDVLLIKSVNVDEISVGDDVAFYAPINSGFVDVEGNSLIIIHRVMRIIHPVDENNKKHTFYVFAGINGFDMSVSNFEEVGVGKGDYILNSDSKCQLAVTAEEKARANYVCKLLDINYVASEANNGIPSVEEITDSRTSRMQYVIGDSDTTVNGNYNYIIGKFSHKLIPLLAWFINFSATTLGIVILVIIPTLILIAFIIISMIKEVQRAREEDSEENIEIQKNMEYIKTANALSESDKAKEELEHQKEQQQGPSADEKAQAEVNNEMVIGSITGKEFIDKDKNKSKELTKKIPTRKLAGTGEKSDNLSKFKKIPTRKAPKNENGGSSISNSAEQKTLPKKVSKKPNIKKIPRRRTDAWQMSLEEKKKTKQ